MALRSLSCIYNLINPVSSWTLWWVLEPDCLGLKCSPFLTRQVIHHPVPQFLHPENGDNNSTHLIELRLEFIVLVHVKCLPSEGQVYVMIVMMTMMVMALTLTSCLCLFAYPVLLHSPSTCNFTPMFLNSSQELLSTFAFEPMSSVFSPQTQWIKAQSVSKTHSGEMIHVAFSNHPPTPSTPSQTFPLASMFIPTLLRSENLCVL